MSDRRVLVTGASGCIGSVCARRLVDAGWDVHGTTRSAPPTDDPSITWHQVDLVAPDAASKLVREVAPTHLLHLAWHMAAGNWQASGGDEHLAWVRASTELVQTFNHIDGRRVVCAGSGTEYDWNLDTYPVEARRDPASFYGRAKTSTGDLLMGYAELEELPLVWGRIFFMYGGAENPKRLVPSVITNLLQGNEAPTSNGTQIRDFLYVEDIARAFLTLLDSDITGPVNVASGQGVALRTIIETIGDLTGRADLLRIGAIDQAPGDTPVVVADTTRMDSTGWSQAYDLGRGLQATIDYWQARIDAGETFD